MILTFAHHAYDHCRQLWIWFWSMTMTEYSYDYNCDNLILTNDIWLGQKISKKSLRSQPPPIPRTSLGNGTCPLARTVRLRPQLGGSAPNFLGKTTRIFSMSQKPWKIRTTTMRPCLGLLCFAAARELGTGPEDAGGHWDTGTLGHWDGRPSSIQLPCNLFVRTVSLELLKAWLKIIRFPTRLESEHTWHIWYILILGKSDVMQKSNPSPRLRVVPSPFWEGPSQMPSPSSNENWPISETSPTVTTHATST